MGRRKAGRFRRCKDAEKKIVESESQILVHLRIVDDSWNHYTELYTIDLEKDQVKKCPHALYKDMGYSSVAALGSVIYIFAGHCPEVIRLRSLPDDVDDEILPKNPNLHSYAGSSCLDLNDDSGSGWKPAPPLKFLPIERCLCDLISLCGKIYAFGYNYAEVFDPQCNDWNLLLPPPVYANNEKGITVFMQR